MSTRALPRKLGALAARIRRCVLCDLHRSRTHAVPGEGPARARILLVGEAPGRTEDEAGRPFRGAAGELLDQALREAGVPRGRGFGGIGFFIRTGWKAPPRGNRRPRAQEVFACRPYLVAQVEAVAPRVVVALGQTAVRDLFGPGASLARLRGRWGAFGGRPATGTYHPAGVLYNRKLYGRLVHDLAAAKARAEGT